MARSCFYINPAQDPADHGGYVPSWVTEDEPGHAPLTGDPAKFQQPWVWGADLATANRICDEQNALLGITREDTADIVASSMLAGSVR